VVEDPFKELFLNQLIGRGDNEPPAATGSSSAAAPPGVRPASEPTPTPLDRRPRIIDQGWPVLHRAVTGPMYVRGVIVRPNIHGIWRSRMVTHAHPLIFTIRLEP
jgi:hypothetical protein